MWLLKIGITTILPGCLLALLLVKDQSEQWFEKWKNALWLIPLPAGFMITSLVMEILELTHHLSLTNVLISTALINLMLLGVLLLHGNPMAFGKTLIRGCRSMDRRTLLLPLTVVIYVILTVYPFHFVFETTDCGVYVASGIQAFKTGSFRFTDEDVKEADETFIDSFYYETPAEFYPCAGSFKFEGMLGTGFFIRSFKTGLIEPRYFNLHPFWIGLFVNIFGMEPGVWLATPFVALCGFCGFILLAWTLAGWIASAFAACLLSIFVLQIWFGRYITTEMSTQACILNGLAWLLLFAPVTPSEDRSKSSGGLLPLAMAGVFLGLSHFTRIDSVLVIPATCTGLWIWLSFHEKPRQYLSFALAYLSMTGWAIYLASTRAVSYTLETLRHVNFDSMGTIHLFLFTGIIAAALLAAMFLRRYRKQIGDRLIRHQHLLWSLFIALITIALIYGYFIRPVINPPDYDGFFAADKTIRSYSLSQMTLRWLGWYLTFPGLLIAFTGLILLLRRSFSLRTVVVWSVIGINMLYFLHKLHCTPYHYWGMRRFIIIVLPVLFIGMGYFLSLVWTIWIQKRKTALLVTATALYIGLVGFYLYDLRLVTGFNHWRGAIDTLDSIAEILPEESRLVMPDYPGCYLLMPLKLIHGKEVFIQNKKADLEAVWQQAEKWHDAGLRVFYMSVYEYDELLDGPVLFRKVLHDKPLYPRMPDTVKEKPRRTTHHSFEFWIYEVIWNR